MDEEIAPIVSSLRDIVNGHVREHGLEAVQRAFAYVNELLAAKSDDGTLLEIEGLEGLDPEVEQQMALIVAPPNGDGGGDGGDFGDEGSRQDGDGRGGGPAGDGAASDAEDDAAAAAAAAAAASASPNGVGEELRDRGIIPITNIKFETAYKSVLPTHYNTLFHGDEHLLDMKPPSAITPFSPGVKRARDEAEASKLNPRHRHTPAPPLEDLRGAKDYLSSSYARKAGRFPNFASGLRLFNIERAAHAIIRKHHEVKGYNTGIIRGNLSLWIDWLTGEPCTDPNWDDELRRRLQSFFIGIDHTAEDERPSPLIVKDRIPTDKKDWKTLVQVIWTNNYDAVCIISMSIHHYSDRQYIYVLLMACVGVVHSQDAHFAHD